VLINDLYSSLVSVQMDWKGILLNPNYLRKDWIISWKNYGGLIVGDNVTIKTVLELGKNEQYSFQLRDGSLLQLYYEFQSNGNVLENASLAFYKFNNVQEQASEDAEELADEVIRMVGVTEYEQPAPWVRIDCCPQHKRGVIHSTIHMHGNIGPSVRIPVSGVPTPKQFIEATIAWFYPEKYASMHLNADGDYVNLERVVIINQQKIPCFDDPNARRIVYLDMPKSG